MGCRWERLQQRNSNHVDNKRILIVEDEMLVALELEAIVEDLGYDCAGIAPDVESATEHFEAPLDLALVDLNLRDGLTGPQIGETLCQRGVPVIFITANPRQLGDGIAGTIGVITKPTDESTVKAALDFVFRSRSGERATPPPALRLFG